jgi:hypothetical protein
VVASAATVPARQVLFELRQTRRRTVDGGHIGSGSGQLGRLAAGRGAQVDDPPAGGRAEQPRRQGRRRVLHPPGAFWIARQLADIAGPRRQTQ